MLSSLRRPLNIVLIHPNIPGNTGCIGRTAMATGSRLHLVHPLGFDMDEKSLRRAGLDYWPRVDVREHSSWDAFIQSEFQGDTSHVGAPPAAWLLTTHARRPHWEARFAPGDYLLFGSETRGAAQEVHDFVGPERRFALPMAGDARSINLAAAVSAALFEAVRQTETSQAVEACVGGRRERDE